MREQLKDLVAEAVRAAGFIQAHAGVIRVVSHYDADGIASAAIMTKALARMGKRFHVSMVKQLSDGVLESLSSEGRGLFIFTDLGSGKLGPIQETILRPGVRVVVSDHHQAEGEVSRESRPSFAHLNPMAFGLDENISGSGMTYILARAISAGNRDLSELAIVGAIGDSQTGSIEENWGLAGLNREILKDAEGAGKVTVGNGMRLWGKYTRPVHKALEYSMDPYIPGISGSESASIQLLQELGIGPKDGEGRWRTLADLTEDEQKRLATGIIKERIRSNQEDPELIFGDTYDLSSKEREFRNASEFATMLNACGKMDRAYLGVALCLDDRDAGGEVRGVLSGYRREIGRSLDLVRSSPSMLEEREGCIFLRAGSRISEHVISNVVSIMSRSGLLDGSKPAFAFADTEDGQVKVSARAPDSLVAAGLSLQEVVAAAVGRTGGEGGGHRGAAGATVPKAMEPLFMQAVEELLAPRNGSAAGGGPEMNINTTGQEHSYPAGEREAMRHGTGTEGPGAEGEEEGGEEAGEGAEGRRGEEGGHGKEMEGQGLVRYLGAGHVR
jgi:single-stranded-DNA-specific exonuclease